MDTPETPTGRRVLIGKPGQEHSLAVLPENLPAWKAQGYEPVAWEDTREPYVAPKRAVPKDAEAKG